MKLSDLAHDLLARVFNQDNRPERLCFAGQHGELFQDSLLPQRIDITGGVCDDLTAHITCLTTRSDLPLIELKGLPIEVQFVTDAGELQRHCFLITDVCQGQSDGALTTLQLTGRDIFSVMEGRSSNRIYLNKSALDIARLKLDGWRNRCPALAHAFSYLLLNIDESLFPRRALTFQCHQNDADFLRSLLRRNGISWFVRAMPAREGDRHGTHLAMQQLVLFTDARALPENSAGPVKYHRRDGTEPRDTISLLAPAYTLVSGAVTRSSWDHEAARVDVASEASAIDQGTSGNRIAAALVDARVELPHAGDTWADHERLTRVDMLRHEGRAHCLHGIGGVRAQGLCEWNRIDGHPLLDTLSAEQREYITIRLQIWAEGSLPKDLNERAQALMRASQASIDGWAAAPEGAPRDDAQAGTEHRFTNRFIAVRRDAPIVPSWNPADDLPHMPLMTGTVVSQDGRPVLCDEHGRVKVRIHGLDPVDDGGHPVDTTAWVRVNFLYCGNGFGIIFPLRPGMEVSLGFEMGDPSRPMIVGSRYAHDNVPPRFDHLGSLPNNAALGGIVTQELGEERQRRQQQLRFNDTAGNISVQLGTDHAATQLNIGQLATPMNEGRTEPRGEGFELRTDKAGAIRSAEALLITTWKRIKSSGQQLSAEEHFALMQDFLDLFKSLGQYAAEHQGLPVDTGPQTQLKADIEGGTEPTLSLAAPAGIALTTTKTLINYAGVNIDSVAQQHHQSTAGGSHTVNAGKGISYFAHQGGIKHIAHHGPLLLQSQHDDTRIDSAKDIKFTASGGKLVGMAQDEISFITTGGAYIKLKGGKVSIGGPEPLDIHTDGHNWNGPARMSTEFPTFSEGDLGRTPRLLRPTDGGPVEGMKLHIGNPDGGDASGQTDAGGQGAPVVANAMQRLRNFFFVPRA